MRDENEIEEMLDRASVACDEGTSFPGMSYEEGIREALMWALGQCDEEPLES
jgi:hypothetical protein